MAAAEVALTLFALCNSLRVLAYLPQIVAVLRDTGGAHAVSCTTWALFAVSNFSTVLYAILTVKDATMAAVFSANTACCLLILGLIIFKRARLRRLPLILMPQGELQFIQTSEPTGIRFIAEILLRLLARRLEFRQPGPGHRAVFLHDAADASTGATHSGGR